MELVFRTDGSNDIGNGHLTRCINIANYFKLKNIPSIFLCQNLKGLDIDLLKKSKHRYKLLAVTCDLKVDAENTKDYLAKNGIFPYALIIDNYKINFEWENILKNSTEKIILIDDLGNQIHSCNILINQVYKFRKSIYKNKVPKDCKLFIGSKYIILKPEFQKIRKVNLQKKTDDEIKNIHIFFSSSDELGLTIKYSKLLIQNFPNINLHIAVAKNFKHTSSLKELEEKTKRIFWVKNHKNIELQISKCDLAIGTPGMSTWERACLGIPSIQIGTTEYHEDIMSKLDYYGICKWLGHTKNLNDEKFIEICNDFFTDPQALKKMKDICLRTVDGKGLERIYEIIMNS